MQIFYKIKAALKLTPLLTEDRNRIAATLIVSNNCTAFYSSYMNLASTTSFSSHMNSEVAGIIIHPHFAK